MRTVPPSYKSSTEFSAAPLRLDAGRGFSLAHNGNQKARPRSIDLRGFEGGVAKLHAMAVYYEGVRPREDTMPHPMLFATVAVVCMIAVGARAQEKAVQFQATLNGASEIPPVQVPAAGSLKAKLDPQT